MTDPLPQQIVPFYGDELIAVQQPDGAIFLVLLRLCENLGLDRQAQVRRIQRHEVLKEGLIVLTVQTEGGPQSMQCLQLELLPLWLSGVQASRVKAEIQDKLVRYQREAAFVLWEAFRPQILVHQPDQEAPSDQAIQQLQHIAEMGRAIVQMAEQQIELQRQQHALARRMDTAARIVKDLQDDVVDVQVRIGILEDQLHPASYVTDTQATEVSNTVKALAELLTSTQSGKNHYQGIFAEMYRRFGVSSYKMIRQEQYQAVLQFLQDWRQAVKTESGEPPE
jgi:predicted  nucleic acid-binding Zn-ribbon protein